MDLRTLFLKAVKHNPANTYVEIFRYLVSGIIAFGADTAILYALTEYAHLYYLLSSIFGFCVGLLISYIMNVIWVFNDRKIVNKKLEFSIFLIISLVGLAMNSLFMWLLTSVFLVYYIYSKIITTVLVFIWNYFAKKKSLFSK
ncbi:MAG: GtrA family protein [Paludibacter sp.]